jgi:hypothetical protein
MPRWLLILTAVIAPTVVFACNDQIIQEVPKDVCYSVKPNTLGKQWVGGRHGDPRMFPGQDCVGCHLANDGPQFVLGGTVYPYVITDVDQLNQLQSGENCFGVEGVKVHIEGGDGQKWDLTTNEAGNFYVEGDPKDLVKPFTASIDWLPIDSTDGVTKNSKMFGDGSTYPSYGGCAYCHTPGQTANIKDADGNPVPYDKQVRVVTRIGEPGNISADQMAAELGITLTKP